MQKLTHQLQQNISKNKNNISAYGAPQLSMATTIQSAAGAKGALTKKLLLWLVLVLQICFIGCFWLLQLGLFNASLPNNNEGIQTAMLHSGRDKTQTAVKSNNEVHDVERVNFIKKLKLGAAANEAADEKGGSLKAAALASRQQKFKIQENVSNFAKRIDFFRKTYRLNRTEAEMAMAAPAADIHNLWCFREGTLNETRRKQATDEDSWEENEGLFEQCQCKSEWHGKDCGQPEVIWRSLITAKYRLQLQDPTKQLAHRLVVMLEGNFLSLDLLELQIKTIDEVVDYFLIYFTNTKAKSNEIHMLEHRLHELLKRSNYVLYHCVEKQVNNTNCTAAHAYREFRKKLPVGHLKSSDLFLYINERVLISRYALKFLKYYAIKAPLMRFRLKYNVYGFFWQHSNKTQLSGLVSSFEQLDNPQIGNADPQQVLQYATTATSSNNNKQQSVLIIGDLNHYGGWYCKYCQQTDEIISELHTELSSLSHVQFPNDTRHRHIDNVYIQKLIANGIYIDGRTQLMKMRRYSDKYYAPQYADEFSWKFGNLLQNVYESLDEDIEDEDYIGAY